MKRVRLLGALVALAVGLLSPRAGAGEVGPDTAAWWQVGVLALVTGAGLEEGQLLVDGFGADEASRQAVAGLSFAVAEPATTLTVPVVSSALPETTLGVCVVSDPFEAVSGGAAADVPAHDCGAGKTGTITGDTLVVDGIGALGAGDHLRVLLVPAGPGRVVLDGAGARLTVQPSLVESVPPPPPSAGGVPSSGAVVESTTDALAPTGGPAVPTPAASPPPAIEDGGTPPAAAAAAAASPAGVSGAGYAPPGDDAGARRVTAAVVGLGLAALTVLNRGGSTRLRPRTVRWRGRW